MPSLNWQQREAAQKAHTQVPYQLLKHQASYGHTEHGARSTEHGARSTEHGARSTMITC
jgi:hypothetical protein